MTSLPVALRTALLASATLFAAPLAAQQASPEPGPAPTSLTNRPATTPLAPSPPRRPS